MSSRIGASVLAIAMAAAIGDGQTAPPSAQPAALPGQSASAGAPPVPLAILEGKSVQVDGTSELDAEGHLRIAPGAVMHVAGSSAKLQLLRGGTLSLCGPARLAVAAGGNDALLFSLQQGALEMRFPTQVVDSLITPDFRLSTVITPGEIATVSASVEMRAAGAVCIMNRGSALKMERLWDGAIQYVVNGQSFLFHPDADTTPVESCGCSAPAPPPVATDESKTGSLFQGAAPLTYTAPASKGTPASSASDGQGPNGTQQNSSAANPSPGHGHNVLVRFFRWFVGAK